MRNIRAIRSITNDNLYKNEGMSGEKQSLRMTYGRSTETSNKMSIDESQNSFNGSKIGDKMMGNSVLKFDDRAWQA